MWVPYQPCSLQAMSTPLALVSPVLRDKPSASYALLSVHHFIAWLGFLLSHWQIKDPPSCPGSHMIQTGPGFKPHDAREPRTQGKLFPPPSLSLSLNLSLSLPLLVFEFRWSLALLCLFIRSPQTDPRGTVASAVCLNYFWSALLALLRHRRTNRAKVCHGMVPTSNGCNVVVENKRYYWSATSTCFLLV